MEIIRSDLWVSLAKLYEMVLDVLHTRHVSNSFIGLGTILPYLADFFTDRLHFSLPDHAEVGATHLQKLFVDLDIRSVLSGRWRDNRQDTTIAILLWDMEIC